MTPTNMMKRQCGLQWQHILLACSSLKLSGAGRRGDVENLIIEDRSAVAYCYCPAAGFCLRSVDYH